MYYYSYFYMYNSTLTYEELCEVAKNHYLVLPTATPNKYILLEIRSLPVIVISPLD